MKTQDVVTKDIAEFGSCEIKELARLLNALESQGLPEDFIADEVYPMFNRQSGYVFLTNSEHQVAMMDGDKLSSFYNCPNCGNEGFADSCTIDEEGYCYDCIDL